MEQKAPLTVIDTDIFVRDLRYHRDKEYSTNSEFLRLVRKRANGVTTLFNVIETCGVLSFNLNPQQLRELFLYFPEKYQIGILPTHSLQGQLPDLPVARLLSYIESRMSLGDALMAATIDKYIPKAKVFVSWNAKYFKSLKIPSMTPREFLAKY